MTHPAKLLNRHEQLSHDTMLQTAGVNTRRRSGRPVHGRGMVQVGAVRHDQPGKTPETGPFSQIMF